MQLLSGDDGHPLWASKIDTSLDDLFAMQDEVSRSMARALEIQLAPRERRRCSGRAAPAPRPATPTSSTSRDASTSSWRRSRIACRRSTASTRPAPPDPDFALGWAGLADAYARIAFTFLPEGDWYARAWAACERALALDPELPEARYVRGGRLRWSPQGGFDHAGALRDLVPAIAARPSLEEAHVRLGVILHHVGLIDEVERELEQALVISPGHALARQHQGLCHYTRGRYDAGAGDLRGGGGAGAGAVDALPRRALPAPARAARGRRRGTVERMLRRHAPGDVLAHPILGLLAALRGDAAEARRQSALTVEQRRDFGHYHHAQYDLACIAAQLGDRAGAVGWLREAADNGFPCAPDFASDPLLAPLRDDPGYRALLAELEEEGRRWTALYAELRAATPAASPAAESGTRAHPDAAPAVPRPMALAVLPFRDRAPAPASEHLRLGLADALIAELAALPALRVRPTAAVLRFLDRKIEPAAAGRELGASHVLDGDFERGAAGLRVAARLIDASTAEELWSGELAVPAGGLPGLVADLARRVAGVLHTEDSFQRLDVLLAELAPTAATRFPAAAPPLPEEVYELCLKGRVLLFREGLLEIVAAVDCFERARAAAERFAPAWAGLADAYSRLAFDHQPEGGWYERARAMCDQALALDPDLAEGRYVRARLLWSPQGGFDHAAALRELHAALAARPALFEARLKLASILCHVGLLEESERLHLDLLAESPGQPTVEGYLGLCRYAQGRYAEALALSESAARAAPGAWFRYQAALCRLHLGQPEESSSAGERMHPVRGLRAALAGDAAAARREACADRREPAPLWAFPPRAVRHRLHPRAVGRDRPGDRVAHRRGAQRLPLRAAVRGRPLARRAARRAALHRLDRRAGKRGRRLRGPPRRAAGARGLSGLPARRLVSAGLLDRALGLAQRVLVLVRRLLERAKIAAAAGGAQSIAAGQGVLRVMDLVALAAVAIGRVERARGELPRDLRQIVHHPDAGGGIEALVAHRRLEVADRPLEAPGRRLIVGRVLRQLPTRVLELGHGVFRLVGVIGIAAPVDRVLELEEGAIDLPQRAVVLKKLRLDGCGQSGKPQQTGE